MLLVVVPRTHNYTQDMYPVLRGTTSNTNHSCKVYKCLVISLVTLIYNSNSQWWITWLVGRGRPW